MAILQITKKRTVECDDRLRKAIDDLRAKYPKTADLGMLKDSWFRGLQMDIDDGVLKDEVTIRHMVCSTAQAQMAQVGRSSLRFSLD